MPMSMHAVVGAIEERTEEICPVLPHTKAIAVGALFGPGNAGAPYDANAFHLVSFEVSFQRGHAPASYGGAEWRFPVADRVQRL
jgi:hypothetical protein